SREVNMVNANVGQGEMQKVIGKTGLSVWAGQIQEEYLALLKDWHKASKVYREMQDDTVIATLLDAIKFPLLAAEFDVVPRGESEADKAAAAFLWDNMNGMQGQTWRAYVRDCLECLDFGFALGEVIMEKREDGRLWLKNIDPRGQETLWLWEYEDDTLVSFIQQTERGWRSPSIPIGKCVHVTWGGRKGNPQGKSLLRSLFRPWKFLKNLENFEGIGIERDVGGMPVVRFPDPDKWHGPTDTTSLRTIFEDALKGLRQDEEAWLLEPPGSRIEPYGSGQKAYNIREAIVAKQKEILMRVFAQFLMLGMEQVGSQALVRGSQDFFSLALLAIQQELLETWQHQVVPILFRFNTFPGMTAEPEITWAAPGKVDAGAFIEAYAAATNAQLLTPLRQDEEKARGLLDLPDLPEGLGEGSREVFPEFPQFPIV
ncbi:MAG: hypothetical protein ABID84_06060, partial [Chloroflexota bacterium]